MKKKNRYLVATLAATGIMTGLKLAGLFPWGWGWVTLPIWGSFIGAVAIVLFAKWYMRNDKKKNK